LWWEGHYWGRCSGAVCYLVTGELGEEIVGVFYAGKKMEEVYQIEQIHIDRVQKVLMCVLQAEFEF